MAPVATLTISNRRGLHARASARVAREAAAFDAEIFIAKDGVEVTALSIMGLMMLGAAKGDEITVRAVGSDAENAVQMLTNLVNDRFGEGE